jgi:hypothetical protein
VKSKVEQVKTDANEKAKSIKDGAKKMLDSTRIKF